MTKAQKAEREEAVKTLRELLPPGSTVHTILEHVSRSGMSRKIRPVVLTVDSDGQPWIRNIGYLASKALGWRADDHAIITSGCGMDMGFHLVYTLSRVLYPDGFGCIGDSEIRSKRCPSAEHTNGKPRITHGIHTHAPDNSKCVTWHRDGGYALRQEWL